MNAPTHPPDRDALYRFEVGDENFHFATFALNDPVATGAQVLDAAGKRPGRDHLLFQLLPSGALEEIRPEETADLREPGKEKFLAFKSDRAFRFTLDDQAKDWGAQHISGRTLKLLAGVDALTHSVVAVVIGGDDQVIGNDELFDLAKAGVERFATLLKGFDVFVNTRPKTVYQSVLSYWEVVRLEHPDADPSQVNIAYTVTYDKGPRQNPAGNLVDGQSIHLKDGMELYVFLTDKS